MSEIQQSDRDIANELSQNLGTLAQDTELVRDKGGLEAMEILDRACLKRTAELFARHRERAVLEQAYKMRAAFHDFPFHRRAWVYCQWLDDEVGRCEKAAARTTVADGDSKS